MDKIKSSEKIKVEGKTKQIIFYMVWALILSYLYTKFSETKPFAKDSHFKQNSCKNSEAASKSIINYTHIQTNKHYNLDFK